MENKLIIPNKKEVLDLSRKMGAEYGYHPLFLTILTTAIKKYNDGCKVIVEIGVDRGESAFAMLKAIPDAKYYGYDYWGKDEPEWKKFGLGKWLLDYPYHQDMARGLLKHFDTKITQINSKDLKKIPNADLIHVDGDHSLKGCLGDMNLVHKFLNPKGVIIVHDMIHPAVKKAIILWHEKHKEFQIAVFEFSTHWAVIWRK